MKKFIILVMILICSTGVYGQIIKSQYDSVGIGDIKTVDDCYSLNGTIEGGVYGEERSDIAVDMIVEVSQELDYVSNIFVFEPDNKLIQTRTRFIQYGKVTKVVRSNELEVGDEVMLVIPFGMECEDGKIIYNGLSGYLDYKYKYLVFAESSELNAYTMKKVYYPFWETTFCFRLSGEESNELYKDGMTLDEMRDFEFYARSEEALKQMYELKHNIIKKYLGN